MTNLHHHIQLTTSMRIRTYDRLLFEDNFLWTSMDNRASENSYATVPPMVSRIHLKNYRNHLEKVPKIPKQIWMNEYQNYVPRKYQSNRTNFEESSESEEERRISLKASDIQKSSLADDATSCNMEESINMEEQFLCDALIASEIEVRRNEGLKDPADWCFNEAATALISFSHDELPSSTSSHHQLQSLTTSSHHQRPSSSTISNYQLHSSTSSSSHHQLHSSTSSSQYPIVFEQRSLTSSSDVGLLFEDEQLDTAGIELFDEEYKESAPPLVVLQFEENVGLSSTNRTRKLNSYARQTLGVDQWDWDGFEIVYLRKKGFCVQATRDLLPGYRFPYGGVIISIQEGYLHRRKPNTLFGRGLHEYLVAYHRERTKERSGKKYHERCYLDGHPRHLEMEGGLRFAWPGIYCSQADEYEEVNAELAELSTRHQPPHYENVDPSIKMFVVVKKLIKAGELVEIDYRMSRNSQIRRKFGPAYQEYKRNAQKSSHSHLSKMFRKRKSTTHESEAHESDEVLTIDSSSKNRRQQTRNPLVLVKQTAGEKVKDPLTLEKQKFLRMAAAQQPIFEHPREESSEPSFSITKWLEGTEFKPKREQRERMRYQYPYLAEDLRSAQQEISKFQKLLKAAAKKDKEDKKVDDEHH